MVVLREKGNKESLLAAFISPANHQEDLGADK